MTGNTSSSTTGDSSWTMQNCSGNSNIRTIHKSTSWNSRCKAMLYSMLLNTIGRTTGSGSSCWGESIRDNCFHGNCFRGNCFRGNGIRCNGIRCNEIRYDRIDTTNGLDSNRFAHRSKGPTCEIS